MSLKNIINEFKVTITQDFIDHRNAEYAKGTYSTFEPNLNALALEYYLLKENKVDAPTHRWANDFVYESKKIDVKKITTQFFNLKSMKKIHQLIECEDNKDLDLLVFYNQLTTRNGAVINASTELLEVGDKLEFTFITMQTPKHVVKHAKPSMFNPREFFVRMSSIM